MLNTINSFLQKPDLGLLILRVITAVIFVSAGIPKFLGGASTLKSVGSSMAVFGLDFAPVFWGILAALTETVGGILLLIGYLFRGSSFLLAGVMVVATVVKFQSAGFDIPVIGFPLITLAVCVGFMFTGPGKFAVQKTSI